MRSPPGGAGPYASSERGGGNCTLQANQSKRVRRLLRPRPWSCMQAQPGWCRISATHSHRSPSPGVPSESLPSLLMRLPAAYRIRCSSSSASAAVELTFASAVMLMSRHSCREGSKVSQPRRRKLRDRLAT